MSIERRYVQTDLGVPMEFVTYSDHLAEIERVREEERARAVTAVQAIPDDPDKITVMVELDRVVEAIKGLPD